MKKDFWIEYLWNILNIFTSLLKFLIVLFFEQKLEEIVL